MQNELYTSLKTKALQMGHGRSELSLNQTLKEHLDFLKKGHRPDENTLLVSFCEELKACLNQEDLKSCLSSLLKIENLLDEAQDYYEDMVPHLLDFYRHLSPIVLRVLWEFCEEDFSKDELKGRWLEALRVSIEEELYVWQEKLTYKS